jgi:hypothetical protein
MAPHEPFWFVPGVSLLLSGFSIPIMHLVDLRLGGSLTLDRFLLRGRALGASRNSTKSKTEPSLALSRFSRRCGDNRRQGMSTLVVTRNPNRGKA